MSNKALYLLAIFLMIGVARAESEKQSEAQHSATTTQNNEDGSRDPAGAGVGVTEETMGLVKEVGGNLSKSLDQAKRGAKKPKRPSP